MYILSVLYAYLAFVLPACFAVYFALSRAICVVSQSNSVLCMNSRFRTTYMALDISKMLGEVQSYLYVGDVDFGGGKFGRVALINLVAVKLLAIKPYPAVLWAKVGYDGTVLGSCWPLLRPRANFFETTAHPERARSLVQSGAGGMLATTINGRELCLGVFPGRYCVVVTDLSAVVDPAMAQLYTLGRLTTKIAHDFNNLLTGTMGFATCSASSTATKRLQRLRIIRKEQ